MAARIGFILLAAAGLGLGLLSGRGGSTPRLSHTLTCASPSGGTTSVGYITTVIHAEAKVDSSTAYSGKKLYNANTVCTSSTGQVKFKITKTKPTVCNTGTPTHLTRVKVFPPTGVMAHWITGWSWCVNVSTGKLTTYSAAGKANMTTADPLFGVFVDPKDQATTAKVVLGFLEVSGASGPKLAVIVGPGQQVTVPAGGDPGPVRPIVLTDGDRATIADLQPLAPKQNFSRPSASGSKVLSRIYRRGSIRVGFDAGRATDAGTAKFVTRYFTVQARAWKLRLELVPLAGKDAPTALDGGKVDAAVTPTIDATASIAVLPFFADAKGDLWRLALPRETRYDATMRSFLLAMLNSGRYGTAYRGSFADEPTYQPLRPLLFP